MSDWGGNVMDVINDKLQTARAESSERMVSMTESTLEALRGERDARHAEARMLRERCRCGLATCQQHTTALVCLDCYNAVTRERDRLRALLGEVEWGGHRVVVYPDMYYGTCIICSRNESQGHAPDCRLAAALEGRDELQG